MCTQGQGAPGRHRIVLCSSDNGNMDNGNNKLILKAYFGSCEVVFGRNIKHYAALICFFFPR